MNSVKEKKATAAAKPLSNKPQTRYLTPKKEASSEPSTGTMTKPKPTGESAEIKK